MAGMFRVDDRAQRALLRHYEPRKLDQLFTTAARAGAQAGAKVLKDEAPVGTSEPLSALYQRAGLKHGALKASVKARRIRKRGVNRQTIGYVIGPGGKGGFARHWVTGGTRPHRIGNRMHPGSRGDPWVDRVDDHATDAAKRASDAVIVRYLTKVPGA